MNDYIYCDECDREVIPTVNSYGHEDNFGYEITCSICGNIIDED